MRRILSILLTLALFWSLAACQTSTSKVQAGGAPVFMLDHLPDIGEYVDDTLYRRKYPDHRESLIPGQDNGQLIPFAGSIRSYHLVQFETGQWTDSGQSVFQYGLINTQGQVIVDPVYDTAKVQTLSNGEYLIVLSKESSDSHTTQQLMCNSDGSWVMEAQGNLSCDLSAWQEGFVICTDQSRINYETQTGGPVVTFYDLGGNALFSFDNCLVTSYDGFRDGYILVNLFSDYYQFEYETRFADKNGQLAFPGVYPLEDFQNGVTSAKDSTGLYGIFSAQGRWVTAPIYDTLYRYDENYFVGTQRDNQVILDTAGKPVWVIPQSQIGDHYLEILNGRILLSDSFYNNGRFYYTYYDLQAGEYLRCKQTGNMLNHRLEGTDYFYYCDSSQTYITDQAGQLIATLDTAGEFYQVDDRYFYCIEGTWDDEVQMLNMYAYDGFRFLWSAQQINGENSVSYWHDQGNITRSRYNGPTWCVDILDVATGQVLLSDLQDFQYFTIGEDVYISCADQYFTYFYGPEMQPLMKIRKESND